MNLIRAISLPVFAAAILSLPAHSQIFPGSTPAPTSPATTRPAPFPFGTLQPAKSVANQPTSSQPPQGFPFGRPSQTTQSTQPIQPTQILPIDAPSKATRARIDYNANRLTISADNSSLTQILGDIGNATGMKITGGVSDERVYGTYGPDTPQAVLTALLDGTSTNMLLVESPQHTVLELILTPRNGGPTPPSISTTRPYDRETIDQPQPPGNRRGGFGGFGPGRRLQPDPSATNPPEPNPSQQQTAQPPNLGDTTQQSPNGVKTPEQIYEQLIRQQQQPQPTPPQG